MSTKNNISDIYDLYKVKLKEQMYIKMKFLKSAHQTRDCVCKAEEHPELGLGQIVKKENGLID